MKKLLLSITCMLFASITMAQNVVTAIDTEKTYTLECRSGVAHNTARYIGITADGVINGQSAEPAEIKFEAADTENGYYIKVGEKYLNHNGTNISASAEKATVWTFGVGGKDKVANVVTFAIANDKYLNNNGSDCADGTCTALKANSHPGGPASVNACSLWEMRENDPNYKVITEAKEFVNGEVYTFVTSRGWMGAKADNNNIISTAYTANGITGSKDNTYFQWTVYKSENNNYYLYNIGKKMFMGVQSTNNAAVAFSETPAGKNLTFKKSDNPTYPIMFSTDNAAVVNHSGNFADGLISWTGGWNTLNDDGSNHQVEKVATLDETTLAKIKELVDEFELDNTEAVKALSEAVTKAQSLFGQITIGEGLGQYTITDEEYESKFFAIIAYLNGIESTKTPTPAEVEAKIGEVDDLIASFKLNLPEAGKYYRIMAVGGWNDDARYLGAQNSTANASRAEFVAEADDNTVFYFDGKYLKSNATGYYLVSNSNFLGYNGEQTEGSVIAFHAASNNLIGAYNISFNDGARWLYCNQNNFTDAGGSTNDANGYCFNIEEVEVVVEPETPTAVENVETEAENAEIYDLTGRKVENITKAGIYIVNGCKVLIK